MDIERICKPLDRNVIAEGRTKSYVSYDPDLFHKVRRMARREDTTVSAVIHRLFQIVVAEYYDK